MPWFAPFLLIAQGITMIFGRQANDDRRDNLERIDVGQAPPSERWAVKRCSFLKTCSCPMKACVYGMGKTDFAGDLVYRFAAHHRAKLRGL